MPEHSGPAQASDFRDEFLLNGVKAQKKVNKNMAFRQVYSRLKAELKTQEKPKKNPRWSR
jgi:hypothetical protein